MASNLGDVYICRGGAEEGNWSLYPGCADVNDCITGRFADINSILS